MNKQEMNKVMIMCIGGFLLACVGFMAFLGNGGLFVISGARVGSLLIAVIVPSLVFLGGLGLLGFGLYYGWQHGSATGASKKPIERVAGTYIIGKLILTKRGGEQVFDPEMYDPDELQLLVQVRMPGKGKEELITEGIVFNSVGEGMTGTIVHQGRWLCQFIPDQKAEVARSHAGDLPPDPFAEHKL